MQTVATTFKKPALKLRNIVRVGRLPNISGGPVWYRKPAITIEVWAVGAVGGGGRRAVASPSDFGRYVNPIQIGGRAGSDYAQQDFQTFLRPWHVWAWYVTREFIQKNCQITFSETCLIYAHLIRYTDNTNVLHISRRTLDLFIFHFSTILQIYNKLVSSKFTTHILLVQGPSI